MDYLIYYETVQREYENACLIKAELESRGYSVVICNTIRTDYWKSFFYKAKVVIMHGFYGDALMYVAKGRKKYRGKIINLQYEQIKPRNRDGIMRGSPDGECKKAYHVCWGDAAYENNICAGVEKEHLIKVGPIQFDLMRDEFRNYFLSKEEVAQLYNLDEKKEWILFVSDFALLSKHRTIESLQEYHGDDAKYIIQYEDMAFERIISFLKKFLQKYPEKIYIYRPHPSEPFNDDIEKLANQFPNFKCIRDRNIKQWISVADKINTWNSTSICEAYVGKKPCMVVDIPEEQMCDAMRNYKIDLIDTSKIVRSYEEFEKWNSEKQFFHKETFPIVYNEFDYYYGGYDENIPTYIKLCDFCEKVIRDGSYKQEYYSQYPKGDRKTAWRLFRETLRGNMRLYVFPLINKLIPSKCKLDERLAWHDPRKLRDIQTNVKRGMNL